MIVRLLWLMLLLSVLTRCLLLLMLRLEEIDLGEIVAGVVVEIQSDKLVEGLHEQSLLADDDQLSDAVVDSDAVASRRRFAVGGRGSNGEGAVGSDCSDSGY